MRIARNIPSYSHHELKHFTLHLPLLSAVFACLLASNPVFAGKLRDTNEAIEGSDDDDGDVTICLFCFMGNEDTQEDGYETDKGPGVDVTGTYLPHPYADGTDGYAIVQKRHYEYENDPRTNIYSKKVVREKTSPANLTVDAGKSVSFTGSAAYKYDWDNIHLTDVRLSMDVANAAGAQLRWTEFYESTSDGLETIELIDLLVRVPLAVEHRGQFHLGIAGMLYHFDSAFKAGGFLAGQLRLFPVRPLIIGADLQLGYLKNAVYLRAEATLGAIVGPAEFFGGYETQMFLGDPNSIIYHGPEAGVRFWF